MAPLDKLTNESSANQEISFRTACKKSDASIEKIDCGAKRGPCPDKVVGPASELSRMTQFTYQMTKSRSSSPCLILILESPHTSEFAKNGLGEKPAPARGATGYLIRQHILSISDLIPTPNVELMLMNAIQWQCSLGERPLKKRQRDAIFSEFWKTGGAADFGARLKDYVRPGDIVFNCCTKGSTAGKPLQELVQEVICATLYEMHDVSAFVGKHPASWRSANNRTAKSCWKS